MPRKATKAPATQSFESEEELIARASSIAPKVGAKLNDSKGDAEDWPYEIDMNMLEHNGYVVVYHRRTREPSVILYDALAKQLKKEDPDTHELAFQLERPSQPPYRGVLKCHLHQDDPERPKYDQFGFAVCRKSNLPSDYQRELHMQRKHKAEWAAIQREKADRERAERREFQSLILASMRSGSVDAKIAAAAMAEMEDANA